MLTGEKMGNPAIQPPIQYRVDSKEDVIIAFALREYFAAIASYAELTEYFDRRKRYPKEIVREFKRHVVHLTFQLGAFKAEFIMKGLTLSTMNGFDGLKESVKQLRDSQKFMQQRGFISLKQTARLKGGQKGAAMALGFG